MLGESMNKKSGLSMQQASERLEEFGENSLPEVKSEPIWHKLIQQFNNPLIFILLFALAIDVGIWLYEGADSVPVESLAIAIILIVNAAIGLWQQIKSETTLNQLKQLTSPQSWVYREGVLQHIKSKHLVPGDIVRIEGGERIPADGKVLEAEGFMVDVSILTGESAPVDIVAEQQVFSGTLGVRGFSTIEVTHTGATSNMGKLATMLQGVADEKTPLEKRLEVVGRKIAIVVLIIASLLLVSGLSILGLEYFSMLFLFAVALAVAAVPESFPAVITFALALGVERMAKRKAVVRKMSAVEALGSVTVIATDKTGTLTENKMQVQKIDCSDEDEAYMAMVLVNNADLDTGAGDPLEIGILKFVQQQQPQLIEQLRESCSKVSSRPFDAAWKYMRSTVTTPQGETISYLKGAPEKLLARSLLSADEKKHWEDRFNHYASMGYRLLAIASAEGEQEEHLKWLGLILLLDPPRAEISDSISRAIDAGIRVLMVTGDHPETAKQIGQQVGISSDNVFTGEQLEKLSEQDFSEAIRTSNIFARVSAEQKLGIVKALQNQDQIVAVTGDGVNDAPALKAADVGIAMGQRGSDVSREVADLVLLDDNFSTIVAAIEEGRSIYENIQKVMRSLFSSNFAEVVLISIGSLITFQAVASGSAFLLPITAAQILWINLLTDSITALSIAADKNPGVLKFQPRSVSAPLLDKPSLQFIIFAGVVGSVVSLGLLLLLPVFGIDGKLTQSTTFCYLVIVQLSFVNPARKSNHIPTTNLLVWAALGSALVAQIVAVSLPVLRTMLDVASLTTQMTLLIVAAVFVSWLLVALCSFLLRTSHNQS
jgi:Ca2+-transporting ATPase